MIHISDCQKYIMCSLFSVPTYVWMNECFVPMIGVCTNITIFLLPYFFCWDIILKFIRHFFLPRFLVCWDFHLNSAKNERIWKIKINNVYKMNTKGNMYTQRTPLLFTASDWRLPNEMAFMRKRTNILGNQNVLY